MTRGACDTPARCTKLKQAFVEAGRKGKGSPFLPHMRSEVLGFTRHIPYISEFKKVEYDDLLASRVGVRNITCGPD